MVEAVVQTSRTGPKEPRKFLTVGLELNAETLVLWNIAERKTMPTKVPLRTDRSLMPSAKDVFMLSLLAAVIDSVIILTIVWAYG
jgi:hypothetical protein